jgi:hypothetical protein
VGIGQWTTDKTVNVEKTPPLYFFCFLIRLPVSASLMALTEIPPPRRDLSIYW